MRLLVFALILMTVISVPAQTSFDTAAQNAKEGQYEKALENYRHVLDSQPGKQLSVKAHFNIGVCLYHLNRPQKAVEEYQKAIELSGGKYQKAFYALGMAQVALGDKNKAVAAFYEAVRLDKNDGEAWFDLAMVLLASSAEKDYDSAVAAFENAAKNGSVSTADAVNNIGVIAAIKGDVITAENNFKKALMLSKGNSLEAANNLNICAKLKQYSYKELAAKLTFSGKKI